MKSAILGTGVMLFMVLAASSASAEPLSVNLSGVVVFSTNPCGQLDPNPRHRGVWTTLDASTGSYIRGGTGDAVIPQSPTPHGSNKIATDNLPALPPLQVVGDFNWSGDSVAPVDMSNRNASASLFHWRPDDDHGMPVRFPVQRSTSNDQTEFTPQYVALNMCRHR